MSERHKHPNHREHVAMGIAPQVSVKTLERERREKDLVALARLPEGRRIFAWLMFKDRVMGFRGNSEDAYRHGRRSVGEDLESDLKGVLPRELYVDIVYPKEDDNGSR